MKIPTTNIRQIYHVACTIGEVITVGGVACLETRLSKLCTSGNINIYSRFRPGYWYVGTDGKLAFRLPRGGSQTDPRGYRSNGTDNKEGYHLGDFGGYNPYAVAPYVNTGSGVMELYFPANQAGNTVTETLVFNLGEVDWFNQGDEYHGKNAITSSYVYLYCCKVVNGTPQLSNIVGSCHKDNLEKSGYTARASMSVSLVLPSTAGGSTTYVYQFGLGYGGKIYALFPNTVGITVNVNEGAVCYVRVSSSVISALKTKLTLSPSDADDPTTLQEVYTSGESQKMLTTAYSSVTFSGLQFIARMYSGNLFAFTSLRVGVSGTISRYDKSPLKGGTLQSTSTFTYQMASSSGGTSGSTGYTYALTVSLPCGTTGHVLDGEYYYIDITSFTTAIQATQI